LSTHKKSSYKEGLEDFFVDGYYVEEKPTILK